MRYTYLIICYFFFTNSLKLFSITQNVPADKYISCLINLCKSFWSILVCYYQVTAWHQNVHIFENDRIVNNTTDASSSSNVLNTSLTPLTSNDEYIQQKFKNGQSRIWHDILSKCCIYLNSTKLHNLKYEQVKNHIKLKNPN